MQHPVLVIAAAFCLVWASRADGQTAARVGIKQSLEVAVTRYLVDAGGQRIGMPAQTIRFRLSRVRTESGWKTTMTLGAPDGTAAHELVRNPFFGGRLEFDPSGSITMFDNTGREVPMPPGLQVPPFHMMSGDWSPALDGIGIDFASRTARLQELEARYGKPAGLVRGLTQYVRHGTGSVEEVLVDTMLAVPVELNVMHGDRLTAHLEFDYVERPGHGVVRRRMRSEAVLDDEGRRAVTATEFSNVTTEEGK